MSTQLPSRTHLDLFKEVPNDEEIYEKEVSYKV
jgi:hypothetical protein